MNISNDGWIKSEQHLKDVEVAVSELRERLLEAGVPPLLIVFAMFHHGVAMTGVKLNFEDKLLVCKTLETHVSDEMALIREFRN